MYVPLPFQLTLKYARICELWVMIMARSHELKEVNHLVG